MSNVKCCVPGCENSRDSLVTLHKFPNTDKDMTLFNTWVSAIGGHILGLENNHIFKYRRVCRQHFEEKYWCRNNRISNIAVPTLNMPRPTPPQSDAGERRPLMSIGNITKPSTSSDKGILPPDCRDTADILLFFDQLFDSLNGSYSKRKKHGKPLLGAVTSKSAHHQLWRKSKQLLKDMKFVNSTGRMEHVPTLKNWVWTLEGIEVLLKNLEKNYGVTSVWLRHLNQDPLENFFAAIRSHGCRNVNPTPEKFESAFTLLVKTSLMSMPQALTARRTIAKF